jgi:hypothetical protein
MERRRVGGAKFEMRCKQGNEHKQEGKEIRLRNSQGFKQPNPCEMEGRVRPVGLPIIPVQGRPTVVVVAISVGSL